MRPENLIPIVMKNRPFFFFSLLCLLFSSSLFASSKNTGAVTGKVLDKDGQAVMFANVVLNATADSSMVKVEPTGEDGVFEMANIPEGNYFITITYVGLTEYRSAPFTVKAGETLQLPDIEMAESVLALEEVVVQAIRPLLEIRPDKMVFNVQGSVNATGNNALELLRKSPGIVVDNNENIMMLGKSGVRIYIDGKPSPLRGDDLAAYLKNLQSTEIDAIEIITNPSSKYDAEGNAGIINIKLKKDQRLGANANLNLGYSAGEVARYNTSINGNYRGRKVNTFGNYGYYIGKYAAFLDIYREQTGFRIDQKGIEGGDWESHNFKLGADYFLDEQQTIGFLFNGYNSHFTWNSNTRTPMGMIGQAAIDSILIAASNNIGDRNNLNFNLNYRFDKGNGITWNIDADYGRFRNAQDAYQPNYYYDASGVTVLREQVNTTAMPTKINIYTFKVDREQPLWNGQLGAGLKLSFVQADNDFDFFNLVDQIPVPDYGRTNQFVYEENINAAYANYTRKFGEKFGVQLGLRMEQTNSTGDLSSAQPVADGHVVKHYLDVFPSGGLNYTLNDKNSFQLSYSRRVNRPSYQDLNPFEYKLNELTYRRGDPFLRPEYAHNIQLTHSFNYRLNTTLAFSHTKDLITDLTDTSGLKAVYITYRNLAGQYNYSLSLSSPISITEWWSSYSNLTAYYTHNVATFSDGKAIDLDVKAASLYSQQTFTLPWGLSFELSGWYNSPTIWGGNFKMDGMWSLNAGLQKKLPNDRGSVKLAINDIFKSTDWHGVIIFGAMYAEMYGGWDSRRVSLNFSYLIGNTQVKNARNRKTGLEEEQGRIKTENN